MTLEPREKTRRTPGATSGISKAARENSKGSRGDLGQLHKKPDECRKQLEQAFLRKVEMLPPGEMAMLVILPHALNGPLRVRSKNFTLEQMAGMLDALDTRLPFPQKRLRLWVDKAMQATKTKKRKQLPAGSADTSAAGADLGGADSDDGVTDSDDGVFGDEGEELEEEGEGEEGEEMEGEEEAGEPEGQQEDSEQDELSSELDSDEFVDCWLPAAVHKALESLACAEGFWTNLQLTPLAEQLAIEFGVDVLVMKPILKQAVNEIHPEQYTHAGNIGAQDPSEPGDEPRQRSSAGPKSQAAQQQQQPVQRDPTRPPKRAASNGVAAVLLQARYAGEGGASSSQTHKAHCAADAAAAVARLKPPQNAAAKASTAAKLVEVLKSLTQGVSSGTVSVQQAQADLQFAAKAVATQAAPWHYAAVADAIKAARQAVAWQQFKQLRT